MRRGPALVVAVGVVLGAALIGLAAVRGMPHWQSIPSTWDAVWHANTIRFILDTGQASPTHMGELRNVETHDALYYPSTFHALAAVFSQLTGAAPTTAYTLSSLAVAVWLFPVSAATLTWQLLRGRTRRVADRGRGRDRGSAVASFTAIPYVEFDTASMPNLAAYGIAVPTMALIVSALRHRDRIPLGGARAARRVLRAHHRRRGDGRCSSRRGGWSMRCGDPVRGRLADFVSLSLIAAPTVVLLLPQFVGVLQQAEIIVGHAFVTHEGKKRGAVRRGRPAHPPPQRLPDPVGADRARPAIGAVDPARPTGLVAARGLAAAGGLRSCTRRRRSAARSARSPASSATCSTATRAGCRRW